jgi:hypothetical protein
MLALSPRPFASQMPRKKEPTRTKLEYLLGLCHTEAFNIAAFSATGSAVDNGSLHYPEADIVATGRHTSGIQAPASARQIGVYTGYGERETQIAAAGGSAVSGGNNA